jgi:hypothetical protein
MFAAFLLRENFPFIEVVGSAASAQICLEAVKITLKRGGIL